MSNFLQIHRSTILASLCSVLVVLVFLPCPDSAWGQGSGSAARAKKRALENSQAAGEEEDGAIPRSKGKAEKGSGPISKLKDKADKENRNIDVNIQKKQQSLSNAKRELDAEKRLLDGIDTTNGSLKLTRKQQDTVEEVHGKEDTIRRLESEIRDLNYLRPVFVDLTVDCTLNELTSRSGCEEQALKTAETDAQVKGGTVMVSAITEMKDATLTRDDISRSIYAYIKPDEKESTSDFVPAGVESAAKYGKVKMRLQAIVRNDLTKMKTHAAPSGNAWVDPITGMEFVWVEGGSFEMGCHAKAGQCGDDEKPAHSVRVNGFWLGRTEVTQGQWTKVMSDNPASFKLGKNYPVETVSWEDAQEFIGKLNEQAGGAPFRLPTEAEWEYACRSGGQLVQYAWGDMGPSASRKVGNVADASARRANAALTWALRDYDDGFPNTAPVASFPANMLGLFDMSGNVFEWVQDTYNENAYKTLGKDNPVNKGTGTLRVLRGGSWNFIPGFLRCSSRYASPADAHKNGLGLRLLRAR